MTTHPHFDRAQAALDAARQGGYAPAFGAFTDDIRVENGPGAGPWHRVRGNDDLALLLLEFAPSFGDTFHQDGRCVYADDRVAISLTRESGTAPGGDEFDNLAVYISRLRPDGRTERMWTVDLDAGHCEAFWDRTWNTFEGLFSTADRCRGAPVGDPAGKAGLRSGAACVPAVSRGLGRSARDRRSRR